MRYILSGVVQADTVVVVVVAAAAAADVLWTRFSTKKKQNSDDADNAHMHADVSTLADQLDPQDDADARNENVNKRGGVRREWAENGEEEEAGRGGEHEVINCPMQSARILSVHRAGPGRTGCVLLVPG